MNQDTNNPTAQKRRRRRGRRVDGDALRAIRELLGDAPRERDQLLKHLHRIQDRHGCLPAASLVALADEMRLAPVEVFEVASFYSRRQPNVGFWRARHFVRGEARGDRGATPHNDEQRGIGRKGACESSEVWLAEAIDWRQVNIYDPLRPSGVLIACCTRRGSLTAGRYPGAWS